MSIYTEFRYLTTNPEALAIIAALESGAIVGKRERRNAANKVWRLIAPPCPEGKRYMAGTFWDNMYTKFIWWGLFGMKEAERAEWLTIQRLKNVDTSVVRFQPLVRTPQPTARKY